MYHQVKSKNVRSHKFFLPISPPNLRRTHRKKRYPRQHHSNSNGELSAVAAATATSEQVKERGRGIYTHFSHISPQYIIWEIQLTPPFPLPSSPSSSSPSTSSPPQRNLQKNGAIPSAPTVPAVLQVPMLHSYILVSCIPNPAHSFHHAKKKKKNPKRN